MPTTSGWDEEHHSALTPVTWLSRCVCVCVKKVPVEGTSPCFWQKEVCVQRNGSKWWTCFCISWFDRIILTSGISRQLQSLYRGKLWPPQSKLRYTDTDRPIMIQENIWNVRACLKGKGVLFRVLQHLREIKSDTLMWSDRRGVCEQ